MGLIGREIVQSRVWIDPNNPTPPNLNYKLSFPITVYDAVRMDMADENSETLTQRLDIINAELRSKQNVLPAKPANYLVTYAGIAGAVGSIQIAKELETDVEKQSDAKIPTERAVCDYLRSLGIDKEMLAGDAGTPKIRWADIIGRPQIYDTLGTFDNGILSSGIVTTSINALDIKIDDHIAQYTALTTLLSDRITDHNNNFTNPHNVTLAQLGAASQEALNEHMDADNPHSITATTIGLENVDNTRDIDKPISTLTQTELDLIYDLIDEINNDNGPMLYVSDVAYDTNTTILTVGFRNGTTKAFNLIGNKIDTIEGSLNNVTYDAATQIFHFVKNDGTSFDLNISHLNKTYSGGETDTINTIITEDPLNPRNYTITAMIKQKSITRKELANNSVIENIIEDNAISTPKIQDNAITNDKLGTRAVGNINIINKAVTNDKLADNSINGRTLFKSTNGNQILSTINPNSEPVWSSVNTDMLAEGIIYNKHLTENSINGDNIIDNCIGTNHIIDDAITTNKILDSNITSAKLSENLQFRGVPTIENTPTDDSNNNEIVDSQWVKKFAADRLRVDTSHIIDRSVTGSKLFTSNEYNKILAVLVADHDPVWTTINNAMLDDNVIQTRNISDLSITSDKLQNKLIKSNHISDDLIATRHIIDSAVQSEKIFPSLMANRVLGSLTENGHPEYTQINQHMIEHNAIMTHHIVNGAIVPDKIEPAIESNHVLVTYTKSSKPKWGKISTAMINDRAITANKIFTNANDNMILGIVAGNSDPQWLKINQNMIAPNAVISDSIAEKAIMAKHIMPGSIDASAIPDNTLTSRHIVPQSINMESLESSPMPYRVLGVSDVPFSNPEWIQVSTDMIQDKAVNGDKLFSSDYAFHVLGTTNANTPPEYVMISHEFIVDGTITPEKLNRNFVLFGHPTIQLDPDDTANDSQIASTRWVNRLIDDRVTALDVNAMPNHSIAITKLPTSPTPGVLAVTDPHADAKFALVSEGLLEDASVSSNKLQRDLQLSGNVTIDTRPNRRSSDAFGNGNTIPDCQWVLDRIGEQLTGAVVTPGTPGAPIPATTASIIPKSITAEMIQDDTISNRLLAPSPRANRVLGVEDANTNPQYIQINNEMIKSRSIDSRTLFTSNKANRVLIVNTVNGDPTWGTINSDMIADRAIQPRHISFGIITSDSIANNSITERTLANESMISEVHLNSLSVSAPKIQTDAVTSSKIAADAVTNRKIKNHTIQGNKLVNGIKLPTETSVRGSERYRSGLVRNTFISYNGPEHYDVNIGESSPTDSKNGDIWFRFI